jgi:nitrate reductase assembly molybdenum cofactor insertion protein NarJ
MTKEEPKAMTVLEFAEQLYYLAVERLDWLIPRMEAASKILQTNQQRSHHRWLCECVRDNVSVYKRTFQLLQRYGVKDAIKGNQSTVELLGRIGIPC